MILNSDNSAEDMLLKLNLETTAKVAIAIDPVLKIVRKLGRRKLGRMRGDSLDSYCC